MDSDGDVHGKLEFSRSDINTHFYHALEIAMLGHISTLFYHALEIN
jgi:hypothetical protein